MAQTYTLEEAAQRLGLSVEEFKRRLKTEWTSVRSFRDGPTLRFRAADIDELARVLGQASDPGLELGGGSPLEDDDSSILEPPSGGPSRGAKPGYDPDDSDDHPAPFAAPLPSKPASSKKIKPAAAEEPLFSLEPDTDDIFTVPSGDSGVSKKKGPAGDSDVRLDLTPPAFDPGANQQTEEITLDVEPPRSGVLKSPSSARLSVPGSGKITGPESAKIPGAAAPSGEEGSSEFELSLDSDSDSFELNLNTDSSEEVALGGEPAAGPRAGQSGINLGKPADSGVNLDKKKTAAPDSDSDIDFELSLDSPGGASGTRLAGPKSGAARIADSDSEFELSLDDNSGVTDALVDDIAAEQSQGDIFETDFELPAVMEDESGSEVVAIESSDTDLENSDFDIAIDAEDAPIEDESASQVVLVDDDSGAGDEAVVLADDEDDQPSSRKSGKRKSKRAAMADDEAVDEVEAVEDEDNEWAGATGAQAEDDEDDTPVRSGYVAPPRWGPLPAILLLPCLLVAMIGGMMAFEMIRSQLGYQQPNKPSESLVRGMAKQFGLKTTD